MRVMIAMLRMVLVIIMPFLFGVGALHRCTFQQRNHICGRRQRLDAGRQPGRQGFIHHEDHLRLLQPSRVRGAQARIMGRGVGRDQQLRRAQAIHDLNNQ